jgi:small subunit ribosomal protein S9
MLRWWWWCRRFKANLPVSTLRGEQLFGSAQHRNLTQSSYVGESVYLWQNKARVHGLVSPREIACSPRLRSILSGALNRRGYSTPASESVDVQRRLDEQLRAKAAIALDPQGLATVLADSTRIEEANATVQPDSTANETQAQQRRRRRRLYPDGSVNATGRRKTAVAVARLFPIESPGGPQSTAVDHETLVEPRFRVNRQDIADYFLRVDHRLEIMRPLMLTGMENRFHVHAFARGGGITGQAEALRLAIARALEDYDPELRRILKPAGLLTRDPRMVERKKYGRHKARRAFQWVKR